MRARRAEARAALAPVILLVASFHAIEPDVRTCKHEQEDEHTNALPLQSGAARELLSTCRSVG